MTSSDLTVQIKLPIQEIQAFCDKWQVSEFALFGSVLRDDFRPDSDIDVMVTFDATASPTFAGLEQRSVELQALFNRDIDVITRKSIERSLNDLRRKEILNSAKVVYETRSSISA